MGSCLKLLCSGLLLLTVLLGGCGGPSPQTDPGGQPDRNGSSVSSSVSSSADSREQNGFSGEPGSTSGGQASSSEKGGWDNTPKVLTPSAGGSLVLGNESLEIDASHTSEGYLMVRYLGSASKIKFFVVTPDEVRYTYDLPPSDTWMTLPLTGGDGVYTLDAREHVEGNLYSNLYKETVEVALHDEFRPFLYPNQYTWFTEETEAVAKAAELAEGASDGLDVIAAVYNYVIGNVSYDEEKALTVQSGYLPDVDETLETGKGICFDYAALMTAMLRSQGIPTKLEIGYSGEVYHAWISTYLEETGWIDNVIHFDGKNWSLVDPTLAASNDADAVRDYIGDGANYTVMYSR
jgi:hypothetical protein